MTCRLDVTKYSKGNPQSANPDQYIVGWEPATKQYRNINIDTLQWVKCRGAVVDLNVTSNTPPLPSVRIS